MEEIIASHTVKPSSPTPTQLKIVKLSSLDQFAPAMYVPLIFFYDNHDHESTETISQRLRQSLSETLSVFYPLAGTLRQRHLFIECDDEGAEFVEARLHAPLTQFTQHPHEMEKLEKLIPMQSFPHKDDLLLSAKATYFDCGGVAIGVCFSHKVADAASITMFMNAWAATCRGEASGITPPSFDLALHFPPVLNWPSRCPLPAWATKETIATKRLVFEREKLEKIRQQVAASSDEVKDPSTVEAFSVLIWRSFIQAYKSRWETSDQETTSFVATHAVNLRPRTVPPIPDSTFGNGVTVVSAVVMSGGEEEEVCGLHVSKLRAAIRHVDDDYINNVIKHSEFFPRALDAITEIFKPETLLFTSWWRFPTYEADFGWGKPVWTCAAFMTRMNGVILMSTPSGDGIEMFISLPDEEFFQMFNDILLTSCQGSME